MTNIRRYITLAARNDGEPYETPIITTVEEALQAGRALASEIACLPADERLSLLSDLHELNRVLERRLPRLNDELARVRVQLEVVREGLHACKRYSAGTDLSRPSPARRGR